MKVSIFATLLLFAQVSCQDLQNLVEAARSPATESLNRDAEEPVPEPADDSQKTVDVQSLAEQDQQQESQDAAPTDNK